MLSAVYTCVKLEHMQYLSILLDHPCKLDHFSYNSPMSPMSKMGVLLDKPFLSGRLLLGAGTDGP